MNLTPWRKRHPAEPDRRDDLLSPLFERLGFPFAGFESRLPEVFREARDVPAMNVTETEKEFRIALELPGLAREDIDVEIVGDHLVVTAERKVEESTEPDDEVTYHRVETQYGRLQRSVVLPTGVVTAGDAIDARYENGMLTVSLQKTQPSKKARIEVR